MAKRKQKKKPKARFPMVVPQTSSARRSQWATEQDLERMDPDETLYLGPCRTYMRAPQMNAFAEKYLASRRHTLPEHIVTVTDLLIEMARAKIIFKCRVRDLLAIIRRGEPLQYTMQAGETVDTVLGPRRAWDAAFKNFAVK